MAPPPPPPAPPPSLLIAPASSYYNARRELIHHSKLKKVVTNDRSAPLIGEKSSSGGGARVAGNNGVSIGNLFANGVPSKPSENKFLRAKTSTSTPIVPSSPSSSSPIPSGESDFLIIFFCTFKWPNARCYCSLFTIKLTFRRISPSSEPLSMRSPLSMSRRDQPHRNHVEV
ncbi:unnamed protein product [Angiostrongylus costaricensis]|uniref:WH2 domain-containing protein n=1 Tax=Angiostrongylus costaricensis TaxID=334426 RepID=A0A0R3PJE7_ANGCS|nr:unnamed protein product [Angiostrongylus costaricensis]